MIVKTGSVLAKPLLLMEMVNKLSLIPHSSNIYAHMTTVSGDLRFSGIISSSIEPPTTQAAVYANGIHVWLCVNKSTT